MQSRDAMFLSNELRHTSALCKAPSSSDTADTEAQSHLERARLHVHELSRAAVAEDEREGRAEANLHLSVEALRHALGGGRAADETADAAEPEEPPPQQENEQLLHELHEELQSHPPRSGRELQRLLEQELYRHSRPAT